MMDCFKWAPKGFATWAFQQDKGPASAKIRENMTYANEVASKLIEEKRQELKDGASRRDVLSLLGSSYIPYILFDIWYNICFSSQGKLIGAT